MWKIGELARRTGLTVRTLHHYDAIGLLSPAERSGGGHRVYGEADVGRLYRIVSLRSLGFPLDAIAAALDEETFDPRAAVEDHLARLEAQMEQQRRLQERLRQLLERLDTEDFLTTIEELTMRERYYTPEQLEELAAAPQGDRRRGDPRGRARVGADLRHPARRAWTRAPIPPTRSCARSPSAGRELVAMFTGGDPGITSALKEMWAKEDPETVSHGMVDAEVMAYYGKVQAAL